MKTKQCFARMASKQRNGDVTNAGFVRYFIDIKVCGGNRRPVLHKKRVLKGLQGQLLIRKDEEVFFLV